VSPRTLSPQSLSEDDRRLVAGWAADCAEHVLHLFEAERPDDDRVRASIARARAFARGDLKISDEIRTRFGDGASARGLKSPAAVAAARSAGQAVAVCHMGAHALGAAGYAARAAGLAATDPQAATDGEISWQLAQMTAAVRAALATLPALGENSSGPLGPGLLASGELGTIIRRLQAGIASQQQ